MGSQKILLMLLPFWDSLIPPLGLACLKSYLETHGYPVKAVDANVDAELRQFYRHYFDTLQAAVRMGVGQLQLNVTTAERLRQAQADPERYGNIPVRVAGYSQLFRLLGPELQELVIARTKHGT